MTINYATGNERKFSNAKAFFIPYGIEVKQLRLRIDEIQSEDALEITKAKAKNYAFFSKGLDKVFLIC